MLLSGLIIDCIMYSKFIEYKKTTFLPILERLSSIHTQDWLLVRS